MADKDRDPNEDIKEMVDKAHELFDEKVDRFDKILACALDRELASDFVEGYLQLRETGFEFQDASETAAEQLNIDPDEEEVEAEEEKD